MITYTRKGEKITLEFDNLKEYEELLMLVGYAVEAAQHIGDRKLYRQWTDFANRLNATRPKFKPYQLPEEK
jgi:hypothetical protein